MEAADAAVPCAMSEDQFISLATGMFVHHFWAVVWRARAGVFSRCNLPFLSHSAYCRGQAEERGQEKEKPPVSDEYGETLVDNVGG